MKYTIGRTVVHTDNSHTADGQQPFSDAEGVLIAGKGGHGFHVTQVAEAQVTFDNMRGQDFGEQFGVFTDCRADFIQQVRRGQQHGKRSLFAQGFRQASGFDDIRPAFIRFVAFNGLHDRTRFLNLAGQHGDFAGGGVFDDQLAVFTCCGNQIVVAVEHIDFFWLCRHLTGFTGSRIAECVGARVHEDAAEGHPGTG